MNVTRTRSTRPILLAAPGGLEVLGQPGMGDALTDAANAARAKVDADAGDYALPQPAKTQAQAIRAYILLMRAASGEDKRNAGAWKKRANEAAWRFTSGNASIQNILQTAVDLTRSAAPRTNELARMVLRTSVVVAVPKRRRAAGGGSSTDLPVEAPPAAPSFLDGLPSWVPWAAGATAAAALLILLLPPRRSA